MSEEYSRKADEVLRQNLGEYPRIVSEAAREDIAKLRPSIEAALGALDVLKQRRGLTEKERKEEEELKKILAAMNKL